MSVPNAVSMIAVVHLSVYLSHMQPFQPFRDVELAKWLFQCMEWVNERLAVIGYANHGMSPEFLLQKPKIESDRFHQTFRETGTLKALRKTSLKYLISSSTHRYVP